MTSLRLQRDLVVLDLETTGVTPAKDRIVSLAFQRLRAPDGRPTEEPREVLFNPGGHIPAEATAVHGITDAHVELAPSFAEFAEEVSAWLGGADLAGFNLRHFDVPMLTAEFARAGVKWPADDVRFVDVFRIYSRKEPRTLGAAVRHYLGEEHTGAHQAGADVLATARVLEEQARRYGVATVEDLAELERDPDWIDNDGKVRWQNGVAVIGFGKWQGRPLNQVDRGYLEWMLGQDFPADTRAIISAALRGKYPTRAKGAA